MQMKSRLFPSAGGMLSAALLGLAVSLRAATLTLSPTAPVPGTSDVYNFSGAARDGGNVGNGSSFADGAANDAFTYVAGDRTDQGQTFTTGSNSNGYLMTAVWVRHAGYTSNTSQTYWQMNGGVVITVRVTD